MCWPPQELQKPLRGTDSPRWSTSISMPRRKQQEPRRASAYVPEVEIKAAAFGEEPLQDNGLSLDDQDTEYMCNEEEEEDGTKGPPSPRYSPLSNGTNPDASPVSDTSDRIADFKSTSSKEEKEEVPPHMDNAKVLQDSLAQMKAVYANLISDSSWPKVAMDVVKTKPVSSSSVTMPVNTHQVTNRNTHHSRKSSSASSLNGPGSNANGITTTLVSSSASNSNSNSNSNSSNVTSNGGSVPYDWHQAALAKTLQHTPYHLLPEPSLFSTVQLYRQNNKLYGSVFTGASKFKCKDCSAAYDTLVGLTVHMNETGHYRDNNKDKEEDDSKRWSKPRKRSLMEMEGKEDAQKVLKCMYCGHSFESLQDLSVHMIKTKHYQKVPLKEPVPALTTKMVPSAKKRQLQDPPISPCSPESLTGSSGVASSAEVGKDLKAIANPYVTPNNRYGYQNGASYTWQFEARKSQILKCMECGSSHDTLQQLTAHMMVTGHFLKVTNTASKKGKQLVIDPVMEEKIQSIPLPPTTTRLPVPSPMSQSVSPALSADLEDRNELKETKMEVSATLEKKLKQEKGEPSEKSEIASISYKYLKEEDLEEGTKGGMDILKSLENTVSSAISKAQTGAPTWGGYPSIHAAYQFQGTVKSSVLPPTIQSVPVQPAFNTGLRTFSPSTASVIHTPQSPSSPPSLRNNVSAMEELVEKVTGAISVKKEKEEWTVSAEWPRSAYAPKSPSPIYREKKNTVSPAPSARTNSPGMVGRDVVCKVEPKETLAESQNLAKASLANDNSLEIITDHSPERPFISPLSALQSVMNTHLSNASKPLSSSTDPLTMLYKISNSITDKPTTFTSNPAKQIETLDTHFYKDNDQPIDLRKFKSRSSESNNNTSSHPVMTNSMNGTKPLYPDLPLSDNVSFLRENALMDISDMVKNLTGHLTPKSSTPSSISEKSDADSSVFEDPLEDFSTSQKRKGRHSSWNPQHLLILQAQFVSSLRETPEGHYAMTDLDPQERFHICKFTGLSMTTVSHWLANVKYQLKRTGGTKFLKNMDTSQPVFLCGDCACQFRTPSSYISHLESHLGFSLKDLSKVSVHYLQEQHSLSKGLTDEMPFSSSLLNLPLNEDSSPGCIYRCRLCSRTFVSKHAVKLHLSKTHEKSPDDHLVFVTTLEKLEKVKPRDH